MYQEAQLFWQWIQHDFLGKVLFNTSLILFCWSKWAIYQYIICYWFANKYVPTFMESLFDVSSRLDTKGTMIECGCKALFFLSAISFLRAAFGDPGFVHLMRLKMPRGILPDKLEKVCVKCNHIWKPPRAHHCKTCKRCVLRMDHHCVWIANCVGAKNQKHFILFLLYTMFYALMTIGLSIMNFILWLIESSTKSAKVQNVNDGWGTANKILLVIFAIFFLFFTFEFLWEQWESVVQNQTTVETHKTMLGRPRPFIPSVEKVFGTNRWAWLLPIGPDLRVNALELLYYEVEASGDKKKGEDFYDEDEFEELPIYQEYFIS